MSVLVVTFFLGALSHLALDRLPHFGFLGHVAVWTSLPYSWLVRPVVGGAIALAFVAYYAKRNLGLAMVACAGAIYPDVEKVLHTEFGLRFVLFRAHADIAATYTAELPLGALAASEIALSVLFVLAYVRLAARREERSNPGVKRQNEGP